MLLNFKIVLFGIFCLLIAILGLICNQYVMLELNETADLDYEFNHKLTTRVVIATVIYAIIATIGIGCIAYGWALPILIATH